MVTRLKVSIYTTNTCAYCKQVKAYLDQKKIEYTTINLDDHPERQKEAYELSGVFSVPVTLIEKDDEKTVVIGFNLRKLVPAIS